MLAAVLHKHSLLVLSTVLFILGLSVTACSGLDFTLADFTPTDFTPQTMLKAFCAAFKAGDYQTVYDQFASTSTTKGMQETDFASELQGNIDGRGGVTDCAVSHVQMTGSTASGIVIFTFGGGQEIDQCILVNENGRWRIMYVRPWTPTGG